MHVYQNAGKRRGVRTGPALETVTPPGRTPSWRSLIPREATPQAAARLYQGAQLHNTRKPNILEANESHPTRHITQQPLCPGWAPLHSQPPNASAGLPACPPTHTKTPTTAPFPGSPLPIHTAVTSSTPLLPQTFWGKTKKSQSEATGRVAAGDEEGRSPSQMVQYRIENKGKQCA